MVKGAGGRESQGVQTVQDNTRQEQTQGKRSEMSDWAKQDFALN